MSKTATNQNDLSEHESWHGFETKTLPEVPSWVEPLGRAGHIAKGVVYGIIGALAFQLAIGAGGEISGSREAVREIGQQPFGRILLGIVAIGLLGYTLWRWVQAAKDTEGEGTDAKGIVKRVGYALSGAAYLSLGIFAGSLALGMAGGSGSGSGGGSSTLLDSTWGRIVLGVAGAVTISVAIYFVYKAYLAKFMEKYDFARMSESARKFALHAGRFGLATRGVAFAIIGGFILRSAVNGTADGEIAGMSDALAAIAAQPFGKVLIGITGLGLVCYAVHMCLMGWYRRFNIGK
ncbi:DUF1206 domain-containing protein [Allorhodopirellula solitaria]|uniref:DUF1206 domain-containing protein n=1 Tax=Allorhodopirellula solitaria TaxID=2527987 RepID=A0A5C5X212_9BACT|nr:DUF1206 domain-containing protein [Allorhodopirellula solitaria]TWT56205.1 hypothetical protein CA85_43870 [Allorhodopirellula solitaria]